MEEIEKLSEAVVLADYTNTDALYDLHSRLGVIKNWGVDHKNEEISETVIKAEKLLEKIIFKDSDNPEELLEMVSENISILQSLIGSDELTGPFEETDDFTETAAETVNNQEDEANKENLDEGIKFPTKLPDHIDQNFFVDFLKNQILQLEEFEALIMGLERFNDSKHIEGIQRYIHTLKGESALLELHHIESLCHVSEDALSKVPAQGLVEILFDFKDWLGLAFDYYAGKRENVPPENELYKRFVLLVAGVEFAKEKTKNIKILKDEKEQSSNKVSDNSFFEGNEELLNDFINESIEHLEGIDIQLLELETDFSDEEALNSVFRAFHTIKGVAGYLSLDDIAEFSHHVEDLLHRIRKKTFFLNESIMDIIFDSVDLMKLMVNNVKTALTKGVALKRENKLKPLLKRIEAELNNEANAVFQPSFDASYGKKIKIGELLVESGFVNENDVERALEEQMSGESDKKLGELLYQETEASAKEIAQTLRNQKTGIMKTSGYRVSEVLRIDAERLDKLVDRIGELVIIESMVSQTLKDNTNQFSGMNTHMRQLDKITRELQEMSTSLRMVSLRSTFQKMARLVRDLAKKSDKSVEFVMSGEDTELDKTMVETIGDPLVHMFRNAVDHGLEKTPEDRQKAGKPAKGRIELKAYHKGGNILIEVTDDGRGMDPEYILAKAVKQGIIPENSNLSNKEILGLIFTPGFSSADVVTDVSGRGIGMDVVKRNIDSLRGKIDIESEKGKGSKFIISLPLTLAIIDGMLIGAGDEKYIIPSMSVIRVFKLKENNIVKFFDKGEMIKEGEEYIPLIRLKNVFNIKNSGDSITDSIIIIVKYEDSYLAIFTDNLIGLQQVVIKSLGKNFGDIFSISGSAILPDGSVGLILNIEGLLKSVNTSSNEELEEIPESEDGVNEPEESGNNEIDSKSADIFI